MYDLWIFLIIFMKQWLHLNNYCFNWDFFVGVKFLKYIFLPSILFTKQLFHGASSQLHGSWCNNYGCITVPSNYRIHSYLIAAIFTCIFACCSGNVCSDDSLQGKEFYCYLLDVTKSISTDLKTYLKVCTSMQYFVLSFSYQKTYNFLESLQTLRCIEGK